MGQDQGARRVKLREAVKLQSRAAHRSNARNLAECLDEGAVGIAGRVEHSVPAKRIVEAGPAGLAVMQGMMITPVAAKEAATQSDDRQPAGKEIGRRAWMGTRINHSFGSVLSEFSRGFQNFGDLSIPKILQRPVLGNPSVRSDEEHVLHPLVVFGMERRSEEH